MREAPLVRLRIIGDGIDAEIAAHARAGEAFLDRVPAADADHQERKHGHIGPAPADDEYADDEDRDAPARHRAVEPAGRSEEHTSELQSLMRISYAVFCLKKKNTTHQINKAPTIEQ